MQKAEYERRGRPGDGLTCEQARIANIIKSQGQDCYSIQRDPEDGSWYLQNGLEDRKIEIMIPTTQEWTIRIDASSGRVYLKKNPQIRMAEPLFCDCILAPVIDPEECTRAYLLSKDVYKCILPPDYDSRYAARRAAADGVSLPPAAAAAGLYYIINLDYNSPLSKSCIL